MSGGGTSVELDVEKVRTGGKWLKWLGFAMILQFLGYIIVGVLMVFTVYSKAMELSQQIEAGTITEEEALNQLLAMIKGYLIVFIVIAIIVAIIAVMTGINLIPFKDYQIVITVAGILLIITHVIQIVGGVYTIHWISTLTFEDLMNMSATMSASPIYSYGSYIGVLTYILLGLGIYLFGGKYEDYAGVKTPGLLILLGGILTFIMIGYILILIGLIMAGGRLAK